MWPVEGDTEAIPGVWEDPSSEMHLDGFPCAKDLDLEDRCLGTLVSLPEGRGVKQVLEKVAVDLKEMSAENDDKKIRIDLAYHRQSSGPGFAEVYSVNFDEATYVAGRRGDFFDIVCVEKPVADIVALTVSPKPRAVGTMELAMYELKSFRIYVGSLNQGSSQRAALLAVRFRPLRPSHPGARRYEMDLITNCFGLDDFRVHPPLQIKRDDPVVFKCPRGHCAVSAPFYDVDYLLNVIPCFKASLFGADDISPPLPPSWLPPKPPLALFARATQHAVLDYDKDKEHAALLSYRDKVQRALNAVNTTGDIEPPSRS